MTLLTATTCLFPCGYTGVEYLFFYAQDIAIPPKGFAIKLKTIIRDECTKDSKLSDNIFLDKSFSIHIPDIC